MTTTQIIYLKCPVWLESEQSIILGQVKSYLLLAQAMRSNYYINQAKECLSILTNSEASFKRSEEIAA
jgi:hypothetical protein